MSSSQPLARGFAAYLLLTATLSGALVMVLEILGSRVLSPFFGVSLFVWTALIAITLLALAGGYWFGGWLADRRPEPAMLYLLILAAGVLVVLLPMLKGPVLKATMGLGLRLGAFASAFALFGPPLFLLGCVSPYLVRIAARDLPSLGRTVGGLYALSTAGSLMGTLATGYFLIAHLGVAESFFLTGTLLLALAAGYFLLFRRSPLALAVLALPFLLPGEPEAHPSTRADGTRVSLVAARDSHYGSVRVLEYQGAAVRTREMVIDGLIQGGMDVDSGLSVYEYAYLLQYLPWALNPDGRRCLVIGLGAGLVPRWYEERGVTTDVVDIDPVVADLAREQFGLKLSGTLYVEDARAFLTTSAGGYDYLIVDVFNGDTTPAHVLSREALLLARAALRPGGVFAANLLGSLGEHSFITASVVKTLQSVFQTVVLHPIFPTGKGEPAGNIIVVAYDGPPRPLDLTRVAAFPRHRLAADLVEQSLRNPFAFPPDTPAMILTDDYAPVEFRDNWMKERVRREVLEQSDWDLLLGRMPARKG